MSWKIRALVICVYNALLAGLFVACQSAPPQAARSLPEVVIEVAADGLKVPAEMPAGIVAVTYRNSTDAPASPGLGWLKPGHTIAEFEQALGNDDFPAIIGMANTPGSASLQPGESERQTYDVPEGEVLVVNFPDNAPPQMETSVATGRSAASAPTAAVKATLSEFSFTLPSEIPAGAQLWEISNTGEQWHHLVVLKLNEGTTIEELIAMSNSQQEPEGPPPFEEVAYFGEISGGTTAWVTLDIPAGDYHAVCFLPNTADEQMRSHLSHGMLRAIKVVP